MLRRTLLALLAASAPSLAVAQTRPLMTEEAATAPAGTVGLEMGRDFIRDERNFLTGHERDRWDAPVLRLVYSPARNVELDVEWTVQGGVLDDPDFGTRPHLGDVGA